MKTIEEMIDIHVEKLDSHWINGEWIRRDSAIQVAEEYAKQVAIKQREEIAQNLINECKSKPLADELHTKILNTPLVTD